jgi:hypothetical protein
MSWLTCRLAKLCRDVLSALARSRLNAPVLGVSGECVRCIAYIVAAQILHSLQALNLIFLLQH